jgi:hypothetical protein
LASFESWAAVAKLGAMMVVKTTAAAKMFCLMVVIVSFCSLSYFVL